MMKNVQITFIHFYSILLHSSLMVTFMSALYNLLYYSFTFQNIFSSLVLLACVIFFLCCVRKTLRCLVAKISFINKHALHHLFTSHGFNLKQQLLFVP